MVDHDGLIDSLDACPDQVGTLSNSGCPTPKVKDPNIEYLLDSLAKNILFETNSWDLKAESYSSLRQVIKILNKFPSMILRIEGHTDDVGSDEDNLVLSKERANAVADYLNKSGILLTRLQSNGYGETKPITDNTDSDGRAINRRVELKIKH